MQNQLEGQQVGRYLIRQRLGGGGVATVYRAWDQVAGQDVALKVLPPNPDGATLDRFRREALLAGALRHPHIVRILQVGTTEHTPAPYIAMDLMDGESLAALLARTGKLDAMQGCQLLVPMAEALAYAHAQGVIHRDVKPSNILLRPLDATRVDDAARAIEAMHAAEASTTCVQLAAYPYAVAPMLSDFGIARFLDAPELTGIGRTVGTPAFMAPEQCMGSREVDGRADIYALGAVLYRCVTGRLPFNGTTTQILHAHVFEPVEIDEVLARQLPPGVIEILRRALAKAPEDRYQTAHAMATALALATVQGAHALPDAVETTATMTAPQVMSISAVTTSTRQVLVPGSMPSAQNIAPRAMHPPKPTKRRGPSLERVVWALFFGVLIVGGGLWNANTWLGTRSTRESQQPMLPVLVLQTVTPTPPLTNTEVLPPASLTPAAESIGVPAAASMVTPMTITMTAATTTPTFTAVVTVTVDSPPAVPEPPSNLPTATPLPSPTAVAIATVAPSLSGEGVDEDAVADESSEQEMAGTCAMVIDAHLLASVAQLPDDDQRDFVCPTAPARIVMGEWLPFEHGLMVALADEPLVYVYYDSGNWEQVARATEIPNDSTLLENSPVLMSLPQPFARVLAAEGRFVQLGEPLATEPWRGDTVIQPFTGGIVFGNIERGQVLFLARAKLRF